MIMYHDHSYVEMYRLYSQILLFIQDLLSLKALQVISKPAWQSIRNSSRSAKTIATRERVLFSYRATSIIAFIVNQQMYLPYRAGKYSNQLSQCLVPTSSLQPTQGSLLNLQLCSSFILTLIVSYSYLQAVPIALQSPMPMSPVPIPCLLYLPYRMQMYLPYRAAGNQLFWCLVPTSSLQPTQGSLLNLRIYCSFIVSFSYLYLQLYGLLCLCLLYLRYTSCTNTLSPVTLSPVPTLPPLPIYSPLYASKGQHGRHVMLMKKKA